MHEFWSTIEGRFVINFGLAGLFGFFIGAEREFRGKDAGISTHMLVIAGSMIFTFLSVLAGDPDKTRIAAQVVSGIGFLGTGIILKSDSGGIKNLTTAASIWYSGAIGMALGFEHYTMACIASVASVFIPRLPNMKMFSKNDSK